MMEEPLSARLSGVPRGLPDFRPELVSNRCLGDTSLAAVDGHLLYRLFSWTPSQAFRDGQEALVGHGWQ